MLLHLKTSPSIRNCNIVNNHIREVVILRNYFYRPKVIVVLSSLSMGYIIVVHIQNYIISSNSRLALIPDMTLSLDSVLPNRIPRSRRTSIIGGYPSVPHIRISRASSVNAPCPRVTLNIGGKRFTTLWSTLHRFTGTKLSRLNESDPHYDAINNEYFFDRNPANFDYIWITTETKSCISHIAFVDLL